MLLYQFQEVIKKEPNLMTLYPAIGEFQKYNNSLGIGQDLKTSAVAFYSEEQNILHRAIMYSETYTLEYYSYHTHLLNQQDELGDTPLHKAAEVNGSMEVKLLLQRGAKQYQNKEGNTPLHLAAKNNDTACIQVLIDQDWVNVPNNEGETPLHLVPMHNIAAIKALLAEGAQADRELLVMAERTKNWEMLQMFLGSAPKEEINALPEESICRIAKYFKDDINAIKDPMLLDKLKIIFYKFALFEYKAVDTFLNDPDFEPQDITMTSAINSLAIACQLGAYDHFKWLFELWMSHPSEEHNKCLIQTQLKLLRNNLMDYTKETKLELSQDTFTNHSSTKNFFMDAQKKERLAILVFCTEIEELLSDLMTLSSRDFCHSAYAKFDKFMSKINNDNVKLKQTIAISKIEDSRSIVENASGSEYTE